MTAAATVSLVTGSVRGLGLAVARRLRERGDRVHVVYRNSKELADALQVEFDGRVHRADLSSGAAWNALVADVVARDGGIDHVVHAVGEYVTETLERTAAIELRRMLASNVETAFLAFEATRSALRARRGSAVFFGCAGLDGLRARRRTAAYAASKSALLVLAKSWALEEAVHGVRINMVSPGQVPHEHASADTRDPAAWERIPLGRPGAPREVADVVAWLCSPQSSYVTGTDVQVAGGYLL